MARILPFRKKSEEEPAKCCSTGCSPELKCPACLYVAQSRVDLNAHLEQAHPPEKQ